jgi:hypothetical protein
MHKCAWWKYCRFSWHELFIVILYFIVIVQGTQPVILATQWTNWCGTSPPYAQMPPRLLSRFVLFAFRCEIDTHSQDMLTMHAHRQGKKLTSMIGIQYWISVHLKKEINIYDWYTVLNFCSSDLSIIWLRNLSRISSVHDGAYTNVCVRRNWCQVHTMLLAQPTYSCNNTNICWNH